MCPNIKIVIGNNYINGNSNYKNNNNNNAITELAQGTSR